MKQFRHAAEWGDTMMQSDGASTLQCTVSGYAGFETHVAELRNANRDQARSVEYLNWRYTTPLCKATPTIAWMVSASGRRYGMTAMIPRRYWVDGQAQEFAVFGDISLDESLRGKGLGQRLLAFATQTLRDSINCVGFVIPTEAARRSLQAAGWHEAGQLIHYACVIDPSAKIAALIGSSALARTVSRCYRAVVGGLFASQTRSDLSLQFVEVFDAAFDQFWQSVAKTGLILADRSRATLQWRYADHPTTKYRVVKFMRAGKMVGYGIVERDGDACQIVDILVSDSLIVRACIATLLQSLVATGAASTVRITLNKTHPYARALRRLAFIPRGTPVPFQRYSGSNHPFADHLTWMVTQGDKDI